MFEYERAEIDQMWEICNTHVEMMIEQETFDITNEIEHSTAMYLYSMSYRLDMKSEKN